MTTHAERLQQDLDAIRAFAASASPEQRDALTSIITTCAQNIPKAKRCDDDYLHLDLLNQWLQESADQCGGSVELFDVTPSPEVEANREHLDHLRKLLARAIADSALKEINRVAQLLIRSEKNYWRAMVDAGHLVTLEFMAAEGRKRGMAIYEDAKSKYTPEAWATLVDAHLDAVGFKLTEPKGIN